MFLEALLRTSVQSSVFILVLYLIFRAFPSVSPKLRLWLWRLVFLKLILGLIPFSVITLKVLPQAVVAAPEKMAEVPVDTGGIVDTPQVSYSPIQPVSVSLPSAPSDNHRIDPWLSLYCLGVAAVGIRAVFLTFKFRALIRNAQPVTESGLLADSWKLAQAAGEQLPPTLLESASIPTAVVTGLRHPVIVLPVGMQSSEDVRLVLAHELAHLQHHDLEWSGLALAVQSLFFFNPVVWLAIGAYRQAQESAADQAAIRISKASPRRYAEMLVRATVVNSRDFVSAATGISVAGSTASMQQRLKDMRHFNTKPTLAKITLAVVLTAMSSVLVPAYRLEQASAPPATQMLSQAKKVPGPVRKVKAKQATKRTLSKGSKAIHKLPAKKAPVLVALSKPAAASKPAAPTFQVGDLSLDNVPIRVAIRKLSDVYHRSISISPDVSGLVTLYAHGVTFDQALHNILGTVGATYTLDGGIYSIRRRQPDAGTISALRRQTPSLRTGTRGDAHINIPSLEFEQADVRQSLRNLFKFGNLPYSIAPEVQGTVTLSLKNVTFETALSNILRQVDGVYRVNDGVYEITRQTAGDVVNSNSRVMLQVHLSQVDVREALRGLFRQANTSYRISPLVQGTVTLDLRNVSLEIALENITRQVNATYRFVGDIYMVVPRGNDSGSGKGG